jgi:hypothetical protein
MKRQASPQLLDCKRTKAQGEVGAISIRSCRAVGMPAATFEHLYGYYASFIALASFCLGPWLRLVRLPFDTMPCMSQLPLLRSSAYLIVVGNYAFVYPVHLCTDALPPFMASRPVLLMQAFTWPSIAAQPQSLPFWGTSGQHGAPVQRETCQELSDTDISLSLWEQQQDSRQQELSLRCYG